VGRGQLLQANWQRDDGCCGTRYLGGDHVEVLNGAQSLNMSFAQKGAPLSPAMRWTTRSSMCRAPWGAVGERADIAIVTTDNPRTEEPRAVASAVAAGCRKGGRAYVRLEPDRRRAIEMAIQEAHQADVVVIAGKGHETGQIMAGETLPFSDRAVALEIVPTRRD
jgi:hypothetical protein